MANESYELLIIGGGPAGVTASVYAARKQLKFALITKDIGGQAAWSGDIENYTGYQFVSGPELAAKFEEHVRKYNFPIKENENIMSISKIPSGFVVKTDKSEYEAKCVIIASGKRSRELNVPGERELKNRGVAYCATCDGPLFSGKDVAVVGGGNSALDAALQLMKIAKKVYVINNIAALGGDQVMREKVSSGANVEVFNSSVVASIFGDKVVSGLSIDTLEGSKTLAVQGVFIEIGLIPNSEFVKGFIPLNKNGEIIINNACETSIPGIFAAGDVTDVPEKQIIIAAGDGAKATLSAFKFLSRN